MLGFSEAQKRSRVEIHAEVIDLELPADPLNEEAPAVVPAVNEAQPPQLHPHGRHDHVYLFIAEQVRDIS